MAKIDLYDPKWVDMVFAGKNKEYGAYQLRKGTSGRNIKALLILVESTINLNGSQTSIGICWSSMRLMNAA